MIAAARAGGVRQGDAGARGWRRTSASCPAVRPSSTVSGPRERCSSAGDLPTALIAYNDDTAVAAMGLLAQQGVDVPGQLSVVGWDDSEAAALSPVGLTSVAQHPAEMARLAVERIVARIEGRRVEGHEIVLEPELGVRSSTARRR